jgi:hypothetical protein
MVELPGGSTPARDRCGVCGRSVSADGIREVVPDSSYLHPSDAAQDGQRPLVACDKDHFDEIAASYRERLYVDEELWAGKVSRAVQQAWPGGVWGEELERATGLTGQQIVSAAEWNKARTQHLDL